MHPRQVQDVVPEHADVGHIFPAEEQLVPADRILYEVETELHLRRAAMFMNYAARRSEQAFPSPFPCLVGNVGVFDVERLVKRIKTTNIEIFFAADRARTAAGPKDGNAVLRFVALTNVIVPEIKSPSFETSAGLAGLFTPALR